MALTALWADVIVASRKVRRLCGTARRSRTNRPDRNAVRRPRRPLDELDGLVEAVYDRFGKLDVLVNNAGMAHLRQAHRRRREAVDPVVNLNPSGPFGCPRWSVAGWWPAVAGDHQRQHPRLAAPAPVVHPVRGVEGRAERQRPRAPRWHSGRPSGQHADARSVPDRHQQGVGFRRKTRSAAMRCSAPDSRTEIIGGTVLMSGLPSSLPPARPARRRRHLRGSTRNGFDFSVEPGVREEARVDPRVSSARRSIPRCSFPRLRIACR